MAEWWHVQIVWLGPAPSAETLTAANAALREEDHDAPRLGADGYDGRWKRPIGACETAASLAAFLDKFAPCKVRMAREYIRGGGFGDYGGWDDRTAEEECKAAPWSYSRPLFRREGTDMRATRHGVVTLAADDGTAIEMQVRPGETLAHIAPAIGAGFYGKHR